MSRSANIVTAILTAGSLAASGLAASGLAMAQDREDWPSSLKVGTASQGGTYFIYGSGVAKLIQDKLAVPTSAEVTGGPIQNLALVSAGQLDLGLTSTGPAQQSVEGKNPLIPGSDFNNIRALFPMYQSAFQIAALKNSNIENLHDLNGRTMGVGPRAGTTATYLPDILATIGVDIEPRFGGAGDQAGQLQDGVIASLGLAAGVPVSAFTQIEAQNDITPLGFSTDEIEKLTSTYASLSPMVIQKGVYSSQAEDINTVSMWNLVVAREDMPDDLAYEITRTVLENNEYMKEVHRASAESIAENMVHNSILPVHPGALRYYEEVGINLQDTTSTD
ncbi:TAXI family TRAP transporter solute-binding subunit [Halomonas daqingensis]|uniref:TAXI family TRAP transporter solute-binding subunit n=1 Tax=Billgrantia desiderata TaxID=52021 RepID=A0ABS9B9I1_9GAMM|nr:TAXI family TRAP transporter solute-binding subunit [Halomonas desiderata]MCE8043978.1 TAXI family TRAP transporter solute-binding subunit [Halomonas desiderata]MCE8048552.1 TAXI family TRAP transporter solute-binding subunit [Halomonas desiderata]